MDLSSGITGEPPEHDTRDGVWIPNFTVAAELQAAIGRRLTWTWAGHDDHQRPWWTAVYNGVEIKAAATEVVFTPTVRSVGAPEALPPGEQAALPAGTTVED